MGNQAVDTDVFPFTIDIQGTPGETYVVEQDGVMTTLTADDKGQASFSTTLGKDKTFQVCGLSQTDTYKVTETDTKGYTSTQRTYYVNQDGLRIANVRVINTKNGTVPTGILMTAAPYIALVGLGAIFAVLFFRHNRREE